MQSDGQPQIAAAQESIPEQHAESGCVDDAKPCGIGIHAMQRAEDGGDGEYGRVGTPGAEEHLKTVSAEQNLLAGSARQQNGAGEQEDIPTCMTFAIGY